MYARVIENPLLRLRSQRRALEIQFTEGISNNMFKFLKRKMSQFGKKSDNKGALILDAMAITPATTYEQPLIHI